MMLMLALLPQNKPRLGTFFVALLAILFGLLLSPVSRQYPIFHWVIRLAPSCVGLMPALAPRPWGYTFEQLQQTDLRGQVALVTGANSGIGFEIARALSRQGASVTLACRNPQRCFVAVDRLRGEEGYSGAPLSPLIMDMSDLSSVRKAAKTFLRHNGEQSLDMLFLNAGIAQASQEKGATELTTSKDGVELVFATNVVGHHLLYRLLEPALQQSATARVVSTSSAASIWWYEMAYRFIDTQSLIPNTLKGLNESKYPSALKLIALYGRSKLAQIVWTKALTRRLGDESNIYANAAHPGAVHTPMAENSLGNTLCALPFVSKLLTKLLWTAREGALSELYLGVATDELREKKLRGRYFHPHAVDFDLPSKDEELQENVWRLCEELVRDFL